MKLNIGKQHYQPDPYVIKANNKYYMYVTNVKGVVLFSSLDKITWKDEGFCFVDEGYIEFWAPSVIEIDNKFYMYVSNMKEGIGDAHNEAMIVAVADKPEGPFIKHNTLIKPFSIDSHVVKNSAGLFIFYSTNEYEAERIGTIIAVDKMIDPFTVEGNPTIVVRPTLDEEIFMKDRFKKGEHWHTIEGAFYINRGNKHYILYSGNCYQNENYFIGYSVGESNETDLRKIEYKKYPDDKTYSPLVRKNEFEEGTGHCSVLEDNGEYYLYYHARDYGENPFEEARTARVMKIDFVDDKIVILER